MEDIDINALNVMKDTMKDRFPVLVDTYLTNSVNYIGKIETALSEGDAKAAAEAAHPLKSSSASLGAVRVSDIAKQIEHNAKEASEGSGDITAIQPLFVELKTAFDAIEGKLREEAA